MANFVINFIHYIICRVWWFSRYVFCTFSLSLHWLVYKSELRYFVCFTICYWPNKRGKSEKASPKCPSPKCPSPKRPQSETSTVQNVRLPRCGHYDWDQIKIRKVLPMPPRYCIQGAVVLQYYYCVVSII